jgi:hypothetical protein
MRGTLRRRSGQALTPNLFFRARAGKGDRSRRAERNLESRAENALDKSFSLSPSILSLQRALHNLCALPEQKQNLESRAKKCALDKVPHLKSSPFGRGEEASSRVSQRSPSGEWKKDRPDMSSVIALQTRSIGIVTYWLASRRSDLCPIEAQFEVGQISCW